MAQAERTGTEVTAVILSHDDKRNLKRCLDALLKGLVVPEIIVVDAGSSDGSSEMVRDNYPQAVLLQNEVYAGYCGGVNCGLHLVRTPWALIVRPEIEVQTGTLLHLCEAASGSRVKAQDLLGAQNGEDLLLVRMSALEEIGYLDERLYDGCEIRDLVWRGQFCGMYTVQAKNADFVRHRRVAMDASDRERRLIFRRKIEAGNLVYMKYKYFSSRILSATTPVLSLELRAMRHSFLRHGLKEDWEAAMMRAQEMCITAETELMETGEEQSVTKQPVPEEFCIGVRDERVNAVYPLFLDERLGTGLRDLPSAVLLQSRIVNKSR